MKLAMISTHNAVEPKDKGVWLDWQPQMNREIRFIECIEGNKTYTTTALETYSFIAHDGSEWLSDISLKGWWVSNEAALHLMEREVT